MSTGPFAVDLDSLDGSVSRLAAFDADIEQQLDSLDALIKQLGGVWAGAAADTHLAAHAEWMAGAAEMQAGLSALRAAARTAHENYGAAIATNRRLWSF